MTYSPGIQKSSTVSGAATQQQFFLEPKGKFLHAAIEQIRDLPHSFWDKVFYYFANRGVWVSDSYKLNLLNTHIKHLKAEKHPTSETDLLSNIQTMKTISDSFKKGRTLKKELEAIEFESLVFLSKENISPKDKIARGQEIFENYKKKATRKESEGDSYPRLVVGYCLLHGIGVEKDIKKAKEWLVAASKFNYPKALNCLGDYYREVEGDYENAFKQYQNAAAQDDANAMISLGDLYLLGEGIDDGITVDNRKALALHWFRGAKEKGNSEGLTRLGELSSKNAPVVSAEFYRRAAESGNSEGMIHYGDYLIKSGKKNDGIKWYERALILGHPEAKERLRKIPH